MKTKLMIILCATIITSCGWINASGRAIESAGDGIGHAVEETGDAIGDAAEETEDRIN